MDKVWNLVQQLGLFRLERFKNYTVSGRGVTMLNFAYRSQHHSHREHLST